MTTVSKLEHSGLTHRGGFICVLAIAIWALTVAMVSAAEEPDARWNEIKASLFEDRTILDGKDVIELETPYRALDAAIVPVTIKSKFEQTPANYIKDLYLVIDNNPSPVAAVFHFPGKHDWKSLSTRVRVNAYTDMRVIAETSDGNIYMIGNFVKAAGGCSAPPLKDPSAAAAQLGKMKFRLSEDASPGELLLAQLLIKHPNNSGLQFDQISRQFIPADFVRSIEVTYNDEVVFTMDSDISISEDPNIRFGFVPDKEGELEVHVKDSKGRVFNYSQELPLGLAKQ
jgi:sulfur-oxidizing protein SoxY